MIKKTMLKAMLIVLWVYSMIYPVFPLENTTTPIFTSWIFGAFFGLTFTFMLRTILEPMISFGCKYSVWFKNVVERH